MIRPIFSEIGLFLTPFVIYAAFLIATRAGVLDPVSWTLRRITGLVEGLVVDAARMRANMDVTHGLLYSSSVLLELVSSGLSREDAYSLVQAAAMETWDTRTPFRESLIAQGKKQNMVLDETALDRAFQAESYVARLGHVFDRLAGLS